MATIEERAEKWVRDYSAGLAPGEDFQDSDMIVAYLAGSAQTQKDYSEHANGT